MKKSIYSTIAGAGLLVMTASCANLDLNPLSSASSENWYSTPDEVRISLNDFYRSTFFMIEQGWTLDRNTDDWSQRTNIYTIAAGSLDASSTSNPNIKTTWTYTYRNISRANRILASLDALDGKYSQDVLDNLRAEARFFRAYAYSRLITLWGDVPFFLTSITPEEAFEMGRTDKAEILKQIYEDYDYAAATLPVENNASGLTRVDRGCALAFKARIALYQKDYATSAQAAKACMDLGHYALYEGYGELFRDQTKNCEIIMSIPHSNELELDEDGNPTTQNIGSFIARSAGGTHNAQPSWELLATYEMTNGKTIDDPESGFDPHDPFAGRDPRCCETFAAPGTKIYNIDWNPAPDVTKTWDYSTSAYITNKDSKGGSDAANAAYNGCCLRKGARDEWRTEKRNDNPVILMRYADVLLMYAEAKIESGDIDELTLNCINDVRARAYGVKREDTSIYPAITTTDQAELRKVLRRERRVEFAWENLRYYDLLRWHQFENAFGHNMFGFTRTAATAKEFLENGGWFWPSTPKFDEDGFPCFEDMVDGTYIVQHGVRHFDEKVYLWPIPSDDVLIMDGKLEQNPGY